MGLDVSDLLWKWRGKNKQLLNTHHMPSAVFEACSWEGNYSIFTLEQFSRPGMTWTHLYLLQITPFALLIPICLHASEEQLHQYKPLNISSGVGCIFLFGLMSEFASRILRVITYIYGSFKILQIALISKHVSTTHIFSVYSRVSRFLSVLL